MKTHFAYDQRMIVEPSTKDNRFTHFLMQFLMTR